jgi:RNA polymerase sigma-70 factor (ECF subfamily)
MQHADQMDEAVAAARAGDEAAFSGLVERYRPELQVHCYRMLGSFEDSEDLTQETFLRAWRKRTGFKGRSTFRAWLYRIATNACLDALARRPRRVLPQSEVPWLQPYPDELLDEVRATDAGPDDLVVSKETIELAFLVAIQHLSPKQRAVLILRDVLGWSAKDTASLLETSVASVNSALQRARATLEASGVTPARASSVEAADPELLRRYVDAFERYDMEALTSLIVEDATQSMPPFDLWLAGRDDILAWWVGPGNGCRGSRMLPVESANGAPAFGQYKPSESGVGYEPWALQVLEIEDGRIVELTFFLDVENLFPRFGLPLEFPG